MCETRLILAAPLVCRYFEWMEPSQGKGYGPQPMDENRRYVEWRQNGYGRITIRGNRLGGNWDTPVEVFARIRADIQQKFRVIVDSSTLYSGKMLRDTMLVVQQDIVRIRALRRQAEERWNINTVYGPEWFPESGDSDA